MLQGNEATADVMGVLMSTGVYQTLCLQRSEDQDPESQAMEGTRRKRILGQVLDSAQELAV